MTFLAWILSPLIWLMGQVLSGLTSLSGSPGAAIILLGVVFSLLILPLQRWASRRESAYEVRSMEARCRVAPLRATLRGEALFLATEKIYKDLNYHPIQAVAASAGFLVMLPVLISGLLLLTNLPEASCRPFGFIADLCQPDGALGGINVLPLAMLGLNVADALTRPGYAGPAKLRSIAVTALVTGLVYGFGAGVVLFWIAANATGFVMGRVFPVKPVTPSMPGT